MVLRREGALSGRLCHVVVAGKGEATLVLPRLLGSEGDAKLAPSRLWSRAVEGRDRMVVFARTNSPPTIMMKSRLPKRTCAPGTQLMSWLDIRVLVWNAQRPLPGSPTVGVSNKHRRVNL